MKFRSLAVLGSLLAAGLAVTPSAAHAAPTDPVTDLHATAVQTPGSHSSWTVTGTWTKNPDASSYEAYIADNALGVKTNDYDWTDTPDGAAVLTSSRFAAGVTYYLAVVSKAAGSAIVTTPFTVPALDVTAPKPTFKVNRTRAVLILDFQSTDFSRRAPVVVSQASTDEPITSRSLLPGDGSAAVAWPVGKPTSSIVYTKAGIYSPSVRVQDAYGNVRDVALPKVTVLLDTAKPRLTITKPAKAQKAASWRVVRGTATDSESGVYMAAVMLMQKRAGIWWAYDFKTKKWLKGYADRKKTERKTKANGAYFTPKANGTWSSPTIKGIAKGQLLVQAAAVDYEFNEADAQVKVTIR
ncbi:hypothetical protein [Nocardioides sp.]|uniref:hypothetical protein n=1 Tax=Nocardioides sp. TaxID=35761 RepID=UPI002630F84F|nr:hypothetical protein [Nocardioides sp.]